MGKKGQRGEMTGFVDSLCKEREIMGVDFVQVTGLGYHHHAI